MPEEAKKESSPIKPAVLLLALASLFAMGLASVLFFYHTSEMALQEARQHTKSSALILARQTSAFLEQQTKSVHLLAEHQSITGLIKDASSDALEKAEATLRLHCSALDASVCYLMNAKGLTIASSNSDSSKSFVGKNYAFRPYFKRAMLGFPAVHLALGITSKKRGIYFSYPVVVSSKGVLGVAVIKFLPDLLEKEFKDLPGTVSLINNNGIVFASNNNNWLYQSLWTLTDKTRNEIARSRQFGGVAPEVIGLTPNLRGDEASLESGESFLLHQIQLSMPDGWAVLYLLDKNRIQTAISSSHGTAGYFLALFFSCIGLGVLYLVRMVNNEIRNRRVVKEELEQSEKRFKLFSELSNEAIFLHDYGKILDANTSAQKMLGYTGQEILDLNAADIIDREYLTDVMAKIDSGSQDAYESEAVRKDGSHLPIEITGTDAIWKGKRVRVTSFKNMTLHKAQEKLILRQAHYDALTHLPNRLLSRDRINQAIKKASRERRRISVMFIDLDDFKKVNDTLGHDIGDTLLMQAATRLSSCIRNDDTVGRHGGDEFLVLVESIGATNDIELVAEKILKAFANPFEFGGMTLVVTTSIGIAVYPEDGSDYQSLLKNADTAMYEAKSEGKNRFHYYTERMNREAQRKLEVDRQLHGALENCELSLVYQPIVEANQLTPVGAEVLLRWNNSSLGTVSPTEFIPIAEQSGLILSIGHWVLETACQQVMRWVVEQGSSFKLSVNVSPLQLRSREFVDSLRQILTDTGFPPTSLEIEVTEGLLVKQTLETNRILGQLDELGVCISMDDFGTGYSSLSYLKDFPFDNLKIDRSFIHDLQTDHDARVLISATIAMAHQLGLTVTAEGIEEPEQLVFLQESNCDLIQGFLLGRPVPATDFNFTTPKVPTRKLEVV